MTATNPVVQSGQNTPFDVQRIREAFPILHRSVRNRPLVYLDNAATTQKPQAVIDRVSRFYAFENANVHRGVHWLSEQATRHYEQAREDVRRFINAAHEREIIFVRGTTEAINLVAQSYGRTFLSHGDEIVITAMEHHANIVPWQMLCEQTGAVLKVVPISDGGELDKQAYSDLLNTRTKLVAFTHISNVLGTVNPVKDMVAMAKAAGAVTLVDGAQAVAHTAVDVQNLDCDFYAFSGHKMFAPTGIGVLYGKENLLDKMPPYQGGGEMIRTVSFENTTFADLPHKFEAGTPHVGGSLGLAAAIGFINSLDMTAVKRHEQALLDKTRRMAGEFHNLRVIGEADDKAPLLSFVLDDIHPHDLSTILDQYGVAVRAGHHCAMPLMRRMQVPATVRASFTLYNTLEEVDRLFEGLHEARRLWQ